MNIKIERSETLKQKPFNESNLGFGRSFTDHMFVMDYDVENGWHDGRIVPYGPLALEPSAMCLHYGQEIFEGLKAYRLDNGQIKLFRPEMNFARLNASNRRMVIPEIDESYCLSALKKLLCIESDWVPHTPGTSLYIRPFIIAVDPVLGVHPGKMYKFIIILSPSGAYYSTGLAPVSIYVESNYVRTVKGGIGTAKTGGNYAASLLAQKEAEDLGYSQVLWLDGIERRYIEEVGAMNIFFVIDNQVITPSLNGSILPGITRYSAIELCREWGFEVCERKISIDELYQSYQDGRLSECFGTGTAAVISPVGQLRWNEKIMIINQNQIGPISQRLYDTMTGIQFGKIPDTLGWTQSIED